MKTIHLFKRFDGSGAPPSIKAQQKAALEKKKKKPEDKPGEKLMEKEDGGPGSGPQPGGGPNRRDKTKVRRKLLAPQKGSPTGSERRGEKDSTRRAQRIGALPARFGGKDPGVTRSAQRGR